jgi:transposase InsO family protein
MVYTYGMEEFLMPWKETGAMDERMRLVLLIEEGESVSEAARQCGVSRVTAHKWLGRFDAQGVDGLRNQSRAPLHHPNAMDEAVADRIVALRATHSTWGPVKLMNWLRLHEAGQAWPCASTIGVLLKERGLTAPRGGRKRVMRYSEPLGHCDAPNRVWCADFKGWFRTGDGVRCDPLTISDGFSRYLLRCQALAHPTHDAVRPLFEASFREYGLPVAIRTDNGVPFAATRGIGISRLSAWWITLGITPERIQPGKPQQNGRHERMHRTLKADTLAPPEANLRRQQRSFDRFQRIYNEERPHQALDNKPPASVYLPSPRQYPQRPGAPEYDPHWKVCNVYAKGSFYYGGHHYFLSDALGNTLIALAATQHEHCMAIHYHHVIIAYLDLRRHRITAAPPKEKQ